MKKFKVGVQLYSVRDAMEKDMDATLKAIKEMGYDYVEFLGQVRTWSPPATWQLDLVLPSGSLDGLHWCWAVWPCALGLRGLRPR